MSDNTKLSHKCLNLLLKCALPPLMLTVGNFSDNWARRMARFVSFWLRLLHRPGVKLIHANLAVAFPTLERKRIRQITRENLFHTAWNWIDFLRILKHPEVIRHLIGEAEFDCGGKAPRQIILCLPHLGSWELMAQAVPKWFPDCAAVAEIFPYPRLNELLERSRTVNGLKIIPRKGAVRGVLSAIKAGTSVGILIDQNLSPRHGGLFVKFFGMPAPTSPLPAIVALRHGIPLMSGACIRQADGRFNFYFNYLDSNGMDRHQLTQAIISANEDLIRKYPEQYTWLYKRWVRIPADATPELSSRFPYYAIRKQYRTNE